MGGWKSERLTRSAGLETARALHFGSLACKPSAGSPSGRGMAPGLPRASLAGGDRAVLPGATARRYLHRRNTGGHPHDEAVHPSGGVDRRGVPDLPDLQRRRCGRGSRAQALQAAACACASSRGAIFGVRFPAELATAKQAKRNCVRATERGEEAWSANHELRTTNRIRGGAGQGEQAFDCQGLVAKGQATQLRRLCGEGSRSCLRRPCLVHERATVTNRSEKPAQAVVAGASRRADKARRRAEREGQSPAMSLGGALHQQPGIPGRTGAGRSSAAAGRAAAPRAGAQCGIAWGLQFRRKRS